MNDWILGLVYTLDGKGIVFYVMLTCFISGTLAFLIGLERQFRGETAGVRTRFWRSAVLF